MQNLKKRQFVVSKMTRIWGILIRALKDSKICNLIGPFRAKYITFDLKNTEDVSFMTLKSHAKFKDKLTCGLENDMKNLPNFHQNT